MLYLNVSETFGKYPLRFCFRFIRYSKINSSLTSVLDCEMVEAVFFVISSLSQEQTFWLVDDVSWNSAQELTPWVQSQTSTLLWEVKIYSCCRALLEVNELCFTWMPNKIQDWKSMAFNKLYNKSFLYQKLNKFGYYNSYDLMHFTQPIFSL